MKLYEFVPPVAGPVVVVGATFHLAGGTGFAVNAAIHLEAGERLVVAVTEQGTVTIAKPAIFVEWDA